MLTMERETGTQNKPDNMIELDVVEVVKQMGISVVRLDAFLKLTGMKK